MKRLDDETDAYTDARAKLLAAEIALKEQVKQVAVLRRDLPEGPIVEDYVFHEGPARLDTNSPSAIAEVKLSELFDKPELPLVMVHFMFGGAQKNFCPMCSMWADGYNAVARHVRQRANLAICVEGDIVEFRGWAAKRGWNDVRLISSAGNGLKDALKMQDADGAQSPGVSVFVRDANGTVKHAYTCEAVMAEGHWNGVDLLSPVWHLFDLLPQGRGDFFPSLEYED